MVQEFEPEDEGKRVVTTDGSVVGSVVEIRDGEAYVLPRPGLLDGCGSWITGTWSEKRAFSLDQRNVDAVREDEVVLDVTESDSPRHQQISR